MTFSRSMGMVEWAVVGAFFAFYLFYFIRMITIHRHITVHFGTLLLKFLIRSVAMALLIMAWLGPTFGIEKKEMKAVAKDVMFCVDLSQSMDATDIVPSRLQRLKYELKSMVEAFGGDRIGLIMFSGSAYVQCPLTYDRDALFLFIETLSTELVPKTGTDFGSALKLALEKFGQDDQNSTRVIILISDGEDFGENTEDYIDEIERKDIKLFTLGIGTEKGSKIPVQGGYKTNNKGEVVVSKLNNEALKKYAAITEGNYYEINQQQNGTQKLIAAVKNIEGELRDTQSMDVKDNKFFYFLAIGLALLLLDFLFSFKTLRL